MPAISGHAPVPLLHGAFYFPERGRLPRYPLSMPSVRTVKREKVYGHASSAFESGSCHIEYASL
jgi:hypothetical protein